MLRSIALKSAVLFLLHSISAAEGSCDEGSVPCDDGQCIRRQEWCDEKENCGDGSDETYCRKLNWFGVNNNNCDEKTHFICEDGPCWPSTVRCDGIEDCKDASDEKECISIAKEPDESDEKAKESDENLENEKEDTKKSDEDKSNEEESNESSEENGYDKITTSTEIPSTTITVPSEYDDYDDPKTEVPPHTTTEKDIPPTSELPTTPESPLEVSTDAPFWPPTTDLDFYAKKIEQSEGKRHYSTQTNVLRTSTYRPYIAQYPTRPYVNQYRTTLRKPAVPYTGTTRPYTPRPYRYVGAQHSGQIVPPYRTQYPLHQSRNGYHFSESNHFSSGHRTNRRQQFRNVAVGRQDWRNGVTRLPRVYGRRYPSRFYFNKNYSEMYGRRNYPSVREGVDWMLSIRNATGGWGKETPRALIALSLVNNSFLVGSHDNDLMLKFFQVHLGVNLLRNEQVSLNRLAMFVNALIATCQNPRDFQGWDLTELIRNNMLKLYRSSRAPEVNPLVYLSLCLADRNLTHYEVHHLMTYLVATRDDEATRDTMYLALEAFACHMQKEKHDVTQFYSLQKMVWNVTSRILQRRKADGSFGSHYSTALVAQALMSVNESVEWDPEPTFRFLKSHQQSSGSFGDFLATYLILPALSGRSLLHLRNTECNPERVDRELSPQEILEHPGPKSYLRYSLHMGSPLATGYTVQVLLPIGISFFDVMRVAAYENAHFKFSYEEVKGKIKVYSISDTPNDPEGGLAWRLYIRSASDGGSTPNIQQLYTGDIRELLPTSDQHIVFWYHSSGF